MTAVYTAPFFKSGFVELVLRLYEYEANQVNFNWRSSGRTFFLTGSKAEWMVIHLEQIFGGQARVIGIRKDTK